MEIVQIFKMLLDVSLVICSVCLIIKGHLLLTKDIAEMGDDIFTSGMLFGPSTILLSLWVLGIGDSKSILAHFHQVDVFLQAFFVMKVLIHLRQCGMWHQLSRAMNSYALLFLTVGYC